jgi:uncharacterized protein (TIGR02145 family)
MKAQSQLKSICTAFIAVLLSITSCTEKPKKQAEAKDGSTFTDSRDGKKYKYVKIGTQTWMAENLNYEAEGSKCYENKSANCEKYGRLYDWNTALKACPKGWHLPSDEEWSVLVDFAGGNEIAGTKLKAKGGWYNNGNGTDEYGFSALPSGAGDPDGSFYYVGSSGFWWSALENNASNAYTRSIYYDLDLAHWDDADKSNWFSVRCLQD